MTTSSAGATTRAWTRSARTLAPPRSPRTAPRSSGRFSPGSPGVRTPVGSGTPPSPWRATPISLSSSANAGTRCTSTDRSLPALDSDVGRCAAADRDEDGPDNEHRGEHQHEAGKPDRELGNQRSEGGPGENDKAIEREGPRPR